MAQLQHSNDDQDMSFSSDSDSSLKNAFYSGRLIKPPPGKQLQISYDKETGKSTMKMIDLPRMEDVDFDQFTPEVFRKIRDQKFGDEKCEVPPKPAAASREEPVAQAYEKKNDAILPEKVSEESENSDDSENSEDVDDEEDSEGSEYSGEESEEESDDSEDSEKSETPEGFNFDDVKVVFEQKAKEMAEKKAAEKSIFAFVTSSKFQVFVILLSTFIIFGIHFFSIDTGFLENFAP